MPGQLIGNRYEVEQEIGRGGMGVVYRARDTRLRLTVALKMLPADLSHDADLLRRLVREAHAASALAHPGVATVFDFEERAGESFIVYEYVEGVTLRAQLGQGRFSTEEVLELGIQLADAMAAAHDRGIIHRDLKPENVMLLSGPKDSWRVKILDFGLAKVHAPFPTVARESASTAETESILTGRGYLVGTIEYMSPEQLEGATVDARSDLYSLGLVLYEMAAGKNPFIGQSPTSTIANILRQDPPPLAELNTVAPSELDRILRKSLRKRAEERHPSARELLVDLRNVRCDPTVAAQDAAGSARAAAFVPTVTARRGMARALFALIQAAYIAMYGTAFYKFEDLARLARASLGTVLGAWLFDVVLFAAIVGIPVRLYLLAAVSADYFDTGRKFRWLFPGLLLVDTAWALVPLVLFNKVGLLTMAFAAGLAYLPFAQRRLVYDAYSPGGGRSSSARPAA